MKRVQYNYIYENEEVRKNVYLPSSDTFVFAEVLEQEVANFSWEGKVILEMGTGSGYLTLCLYDLLNKENKKVQFFYCVDINKEACKCVRKLMEVNQITNVEIINSDLFKNLNKKNQFDVILFNPPYVITEEDEMNRTDIVASYAGGVLGREIIMRFLLQVYDHLHQHGVIYLLMEKNNIPHEIMNQKEVKNKFDYTELKRKKTLNETISIFKIFKRKKTPAL